jgi:hypothetical protein
MAGISQLGLSIIRDEINWLRGYSFENDSIKATFLEIPAPKTARISLSPESR